MNYVMFAELILTELWTGTEIRFLNSLWQHQCKYTYCDVRCPAIIKTRDFLTYAREKHKKRKRRASSDALTACRDKILKNKVISSDPCLAYFDVTTRLT